MDSLTAQQQELMTKALDGVLTPEEQAEFDELMRVNSAFRHEWESLKSIKEVTATMTFKRPPEETWDRYWAGVYARLERGIGWLLLSVGAAVLLAIAGYHAVMNMIEDQSTPLSIKLAVGAVVIGVAVLLVSVLREKWFVRKTDKYREIIR
jgi:ferric-dicitrate binding protein FerR (iron transport regulator)